VNSEFNPFTRALLYAPARLYAAGVRLRLALYRNDLLKSHRLNAPVISVGNLTLGGTGKTPFTAFIARYLRDEGHSVAILSRGYKRSGSGRVEVSDEKSVLRGPLEAGDEPYLLAMACPGVRVLVDKDRYAAGRWLSGRTPISAFVLDDAFQHLRLRRDLNLLLVDATEPLHKAEMFPLGRLREPLTGLRRADAVIVTRSDQHFDRAAFESAIDRHCRKDTPVFYAYHEMTKLRPLTRMRCQGAGEVDLPLKVIRWDVAAVSGVARPGRFISDLQRSGMAIALRRDFRDHHRYTGEEFIEIIEQAQKVGAAAIVTTEKDAANIPADVVRSSMLPVYAAQIEFRCEDEVRLKKLILNAVSNRRF